MIADTVLDALFSLGYWLVDQLPEVDLMVMWGWVGHLAEHLGWVGAYMDVYAVVGVLGAILTAELAVWVIQSLVWVWHQLPIPK